MRRQIVFVLGVVYAFAIASAAQAQSWSFEDESAGQPPAGWRVEATRQKGPLATWQIATDATAPDGSQVLALTAPNHRSSGTFNLCWTAMTKFENGTISVSFKANAGNVDQGGGPIWRVQDKDNYYVCRANPLEDNFRLYRVTDGKRTQLASANVSVPQGRWHTIRVTQRGAHIECSFNGTKLLEADDDSIPREGGVGFWTKADASTSFDTLDVASDD